MAFNQNRPRQHGGGQHRGGGRQGGGQKPRTGNPILLLTDNPDDTLQDGSASDTQKLTLKLGQGIPDPTEEIRCMIEVQGEPYPSAYNVKQDRTVTLDNLKLNLTESVTVRTYDAANPGRDHKLTVPQYLIEKYKKSKAASKSATKPSSTRDIEATGEMDPDPDGKFLVSIVTRENGNTKQRDFRVLCSTPMTIEEADTGNTFGPGRVFDSNSSATGRRALLFQIEDNRVRHATITFTLDNDEQAIVHLVK